MESLFSALQPKKILIDHHPHGKYLRFIRSVVGSELHSSGFRAGYCIYGLKGI